MMFGWRTPVSLVNARVVPGETPRGDGLDRASTIRFASRVLSIGEPPRSGDLVLDIDGAFVLPGLVNAHDHLELNHYGRLKERERYENASAWIEDLRPRLQRDPALVAGRAHPLAWRLFAGGLKNLLAGATTVAHHNPAYPEIGRRFPVRLLRRFGWAHSLAMQAQPVGARGEPGGDVRARYRATPHDAPFVVHAAEGVDDRAAGEIDRLEALGCLDGNTVLVHGVAIQPDRWKRLAAAGSSLVWCPASNRFLFGTTAPVRRILDECDLRPAVSLGTDSRVTGSRDLLDELRAAKAAAPVSADELFRMVTASPARALRLTYAGRLVPGGPADLFVLPSRHEHAADALLDASRRDISLVVIGGRPAIGHRRFAALFQARRVAAQPIVVDGHERLAAVDLARAIGRSPIVEPGVACA